MSTLILLSETVAKEESHLPFAATMGVTVFVLFCILLFAVTRLNPDR